MARIIEKPKEKTVKCHNCTSVIGYTFDDVSYSRDSDGDVRRLITCPKCNARIAVSEFSRE
jgi:DNA-directed RNA polymerase subunit RPC12/RpoP